MPQIKPINWSVHEIRDIDQTNAIVELEHMLSAFIKIADIAENILNFRIDSLQKIPGLSSSFVADD